MAGLKSPTGGSGKLLTWSRKRKIIGIISEAILDEILRNISKISLRREKAEGKLRTIFAHINKVPKTKNVDLYRKIVIDYGDAHVLASASESNAKFLVTLDKKHLLVLKKKVKKFKIVSPGEFIQKIAKK